jgi:ureidoacrylate peracid hydrolase
MRWWMISPPPILRSRKSPFSGFYMTRLEWVLREAGITTLVFCGIVTNGGVAATLRDAHVRGFNIILLEDGCAAFSDDLHRASITSLGSVAEVMSFAQFHALIEDA